eukprot:TRINITY_DN7130_c0_g1_i1.p1 TRINITY_DN7130_c0_g1~~TRINITY_DN7130_c0_g1_i1.p1  ORF type:complete len:208 (+),score=52.19 TRINITY_DN7130_c0_g1_i1:48-626(+)
MTTHVTPTGLSSLTLIHTLSSISTLRAELFDLSVKQTWSQSISNNADLVLVESIETKTQQLEFFSSHIKHMMDHHGKDRIMNQLLEPYAGDCLVLEAQYQRPLQESLSIMVSTLRSLPEILSSLEALGTAVAPYQPATPDGRTDDARSRPMHAALEQLASTVAKCQRYTQAMLQMRRAMDAVQPTSLLMSTD